MGFARVIPATPNYLNFRTICTLTFIHIQIQIQIFLDFPEAFDRVPHVRLASKLCQINIVFYAILGFSASFHEKFNTQS